MSIKLTNGKIDSSNNKIEYTDWNSGDGLEFDGVNDYVGLPLPDPVSKYNDLTATYSLFWIGTVHSFDKILRIVNISVMGTVDRKFELTSSFFDSSFQRITFSANIKPTIARGSNTIVSQEKVLSLNDLVTIGIVKNSDVLTNWKMYINGISIPFDIYKNNAIESSNDSTRFSIGRGGDTTISVTDEATFYDFKIFDKALTDKEMYELYIKQGQVIPSSCIDFCDSDWRFNDKAGTTLKDKSPNNNDGSLINFNNTSLGTSNQWVDKYGNPITQY